jgi:protein phosphatase
MSNVPSADTAELPALDETHARHFGPVPPPVAVEFGALSHPGRVRPNNEDHYLVIERRRSRKVLLTNLPPGTLPPADDIAYVLAVADGMGGAAFGEVASALALRSGWDQGPSTIKWTWVITDKEVEELKERLELLFQRMDQTLRDCAEADAGYAGMGTTLTGFVTVGPEAFVGHVGDSRAYLYRDGRLKQLTRDHTVAQAYLDLGLPAARSWYHMLTNCLGGPERAVRLEFHHFHLRDGDQLLVCTDGLTDMVPDEDIARVAGQGDRPQEKTQALVDLALERGGKDNVTVVLAQYSLQMREVGP